MARLSGCSAGSAFAAWLWGVTLTGAVLTGAVLTSAVDAQQRLDQVFPMRGTPASGPITSVSPTEVVIQVRGLEQRFSVLDIKRVMFGDEPREMSAARDSILDGQWEAGLDQLKRIDGSSLARDLVRHDLEYYMAFAQAKLALTGGGDKDAAGQALFAFARGAPKSFHFVEAAELLGDLAVARGKYEEAVKFYAYLTKTAKEASWAEFELRVGVLEARVLEAQGKFAEAAARYDAVIGVSIDSAEAIRHKNFAHVGKAAAVAELGRAEEGIKLLEEIIQRNDPQDTELFGRAYNALGRCLVKLGKPADALLAYLHVDGLFFHEPEAHAESLYNLSKLWTTANRSDRAVAARSLLMERYSGSSWARRD